MAVQRKGTVAQHQGRNATVSEQTNLEGLSTKKDDGITDKERLQVVWNFCNDEMNAQRHSESQRSTMTQALLAVDAVILAFLPKERPLTPNDLPPIVMLFSLGVFGAFFSWSYWERFLLHRAIVRECRDKIDELLDPQEENKEKRTIRAIREAAKDKHYTKNLLEDGRIKDSSPQYLLWILIHVIVVFTAFVLGCIALFDR